MGTLYGHAIKTATIGTDGSVTTAIGINGFNKIGIEIPTAAVGIITATCNIKVQVAQQSTDTFRPLYAQGVYSAGSGILEWEIPSNIGNLITEAPVNGWNFMKIQVSNTATANFQTVVHMSNLHLM